MVRSRGRIDVTVQLGNYKDLPGRLPCGELAPLAQETSKRVAIDKAKSHGLEFVPVSEHETVNDGTPADRAEDFLADYEFKAARGKAGEITSFTFYYASRMVLELKKIVPVDMSLPAQASPLPSIPDTVLATAAPTQQVVKAGPTPETATHTDKDARAVPIVAESKAKPTVVKLESARVPVIKTEQPAQATIKVEPKSTENATAATSTPTLPTRIATPTAPRAKTNSAVICLDDDDDELTVVSAQETRRRNIKREPGTTIDFTSDEPAAKKMKREPRNTIDITSDEPAVKKIKLEANVLAGSRAASVATASTAGTPVPGGRSKRRRREPRFSSSLSSWK
ncbi:hypothetical protein LTR17_002587 [Elasticomyces elasticus]|nr:hypothetical protein LTR17_002587 [Elasticomyces elasticus]